MKNPNPNQEWLRKLECAQDLIQTAMWAHLDGDHQLSKKTLQDAMQQVRQCLYTPNV